MALVPPIGDPHYASAREGLALSDTLRLPESFRGSDVFALHPALAPLMPLVVRGELAIVHAAGSPDASRSHFNAQDRMESGRPGGRRLDDGWSARALADANDEREPFDTLALGGDLPLSLRGSGAFAMASPAAFGIPAADGEARRALTRMYATADSDSARAAGRAALGALESYEQRMRGHRHSVADARWDRISEREQRRRWHRASRARGRLGLARSITSLRQLEDAGVTVQALCLESGGWDTHRGQGLEKGAFANRAADLAESLAEIGRAWSHWAVVVMTEFGRTVRPNGSRSSDHGHGSVMLIAGSDAHAGVHGEWPGLAQSALWEGRDLRVVTDYRNVLSEVLRSHLGKTPGQAYSPTSPRGTSV